MGEIIVSIVAGGGLVVSGIILIIVSNIHIKKYAIENTAEEAKK